MYAACASLDRTPAPELSAVDSFSDPLRKPSLPHLLPLSLSDPRILGLEDKLCGRLDAVQSNWRRRPLLKRAVPAESAADAEEMLDEAAETVDANRLWRRILVEWDGRLGGLAVGSKIKRSGGSVS